MTLRFTNAAFRQLSRLERNIQRRVVEKLEFYCLKDQPLQFAEKLRDPRFGQWRFRIGEYRALFDVENAKIVILSIGHRRDIYK